MEPNEYSSKRISLQAPPGTDPTIPQVQKLEALRLGSLDALRRVHVPRPAAHPCLVADRPRLATRAGQGQARDGSIRTTFDWYGHLFEGHDDEQLADLAEVVRGASAGSARPTTPFLARVGTLTP